MPSLASTKTTLNVTPAAPSASGYPQINAASKNSLSAEMKQKYMKMFFTVKCATNRCHKITNVENSLDVSRSASKNEGFFLSFVAIHDFKQLCCLCFPEQSKECSIAKNEARPADPTKSNNVFSCLPLLTLLNKTQIDRVFQFCNHLHIKLLQLVFLVYSLLQN